jgi:DNA-binding GntR family transcriptional regulator
MAAPQTLTRSSARSGRRTGTTSRAPQGAPETVRLQRNTIAAQIRSLLRREIISGKVLPRTMLSEQELSGRFGVSRTPIREALIKLSEEGLVEVYPQYGSFVAPIKLNDVFDSQFVREALECAAVEKAAHNIDDMQARELTRVIERQRSLLRPEDQERFFRADEDMHALIMKIAGHATAWNHVESAKAQMDRVRYLAMTIPRKQSAVLAEHMAVVKNLVARNRVGAVKAMRAHLRGIFKTIEILTQEKNNYFSEESGRAAALPSRSSVGRSGVSGRQNVSRSSKVK